MNIYLRQTITNSTTSFQPKGAKYLQAIKKAKLITKKIIEKKAIINSDYPKHKQVRDKRLLGCGKYRRL